jgi:hypothetical protein
MPERLEPGHYRVGEIKQKRGGPRPRECGVFGVIKGENIEENGHLEWSHICEGIIKTSSWCAYRIGPGDNGHGTRTDLLNAVDRKSDAVDYLQRRYGDQFDEEY